MTQSIPGVHFQTESPSHLSITQKITNESNKEYKSHLLLKMRRQLDFCPNFLSPSPSSVIISCLQVQVPLWSSSSSSTVWSQFLARDSQTLKVNNFLSMILLILDWDCWLINNKELERKIQRKISILWVCLTSWSKWNCWWNWLVLFPSEKNNTAE